LQAPSLRLRHLAGLIVACGLAAGPLFAQSDSGTALEQARAIVGAVESRGFAAPPGSIADITAILDQQKPDPAAAAANKAKADGTPPTDMKDIPLARFYLARGTAAGDIGRDAQRLDDLQKAYDLILPHRDKAVGDYATAANLLAVAETHAGYRKKALALREEKVAFLESLASGGENGSKKKNAHQGALFSEYYNLVYLYVGFGQFDKARETLDKIDALLEKSQNWPNLGGNASIFQARTDWAHATFLDGVGHYADAEPYFRRALAENLAGIEALQSASDQQSTPNLDAVVGSQDGILQNFAHDLAQQGRLFEAESAARLALLDQLKRHGRYAGETATSLGVLGGILLEEGRARDAEKLARAAIDIYQHLGHAPDSGPLNGAYSNLAQTLVVQRRYAEAMTAFNLIRQGMADNPQAADNILGNPAYEIALLRTGQAAAAVPIAEKIYDRRRHALGDKHYDTAEAEGLYAAALAANGEASAADQAFRAALPILLGSSRNGSDAQGSTQGRQRRLRFILERYLNLLWGERAAIGEDAAATESFRIADAARGQAVQQALVASAARAAVHDPGLSDLVRRVQDAERQISALNATLAQALAVPEDQQDPNAIQSLRSQVDQLRDARATLREEIEKRFPDYVNLIDPRPITTAEVQAVLKPGQALIATYVAEDRTYVWALRRQGAVAFGVAPLGAADINRDVAALRRALDPDADSLAQIPAFDVVASSRLYDALLQPVAAGWKGASDLLVVPHGALAELPFALMVTKPVQPAVDPAGRPLFSGYKSVPWLIRQASITQLPSVAALRSLATLATAAPAAKPFIGFGDAWFNKAEAQEGEAAMQLASTSGGGLTTRGVHVKFRGLPAQASAAPDLSVLPRLPETADELRAAAKALDASPSADVYLGKRANEQAVRTLKLDDRRVVMFATHGLVPGDIAGLSEPALALTAPSIAGVAGSGLLTTTKILGLRLNAQWVVLSACNTAAGNGAGADAVTGLGLAFIYAGARAVLVSNWPVETTSARLLTTDTFKALARGQGTTRAAALRAAMLSLIDGPGYVDASGKTLFSYAHPIFWGPFTLVGDGGS
jgi:CHAT domain-containing protein